MCDSTSNSEVFQNHSSDKLTEEGLNDAYKVIEDLFQIGDVFELKEMLWNSFKSNITGTYHKQLTRKERNDVVYIHEYMERLLDAVHIINENRKPSNATGIKDDMIVLYPVTSENFNRVGIEKICNKAAISSAKELQSIITSIVRYTNAEKIFFLSLATEANRKVQYDFLALLPGNSTLTFKEYQNLVETNCSEFGSVMLWCSHLGGVNKLLKDGHIFYSAVCIDDRLVYDNRRISLPEKGNIDIAAVITKSQTVSNGLFATAKSFLDGARYYATTEQIKTAAFMVHQATEHALRALLFSVTAYNSYNHNLDNLLRHCNYCAPELNKIFPRDTDKEREIFHLLNNAYVGTRYKTSYEISPDDLILLLERVAYLQIEVQQFFEEKLIAFKNSF
jgi:HEPN domain-containing protein